MFRVALNTLTAEATGHATRASVSAAALCSRAHHFRGLPCSAPRFGASLAGEAGIRPGLACASCGVRASLPCTARGVSAHRSRRKPGVRTLALAANTPRLSNPGLIKTRYSAPARWPVRGFGQPLANRCVSLCGLRL